MYKLDMYQLSNHGQTYTLYVILHLLYFLDILLYVIY